MDKRLSAATRWVGALLGAPDAELRPASADASFRRYFRLAHGGRSYIVMDAPPDREPTQPYVRAARQLRRLGLNVPEVIEQDARRGFLLLSDLGDATYLQHLEERTADRLYGDALRALAVLQAGTGIDPRFFPPYDRTLLESEMALFAEWYVDRHLGRVLDPGRREVVARAFDLLCRNALAQPQVWVHRDYHSRNLMVTDSNNPGILDFQDAVTGPVTYDLVSLLRDCYVEWPRPRVRQWVLEYHALAARSGIPVCADPDLFLRWFDLTGLQRHVKVLGIFARLYHRDGKECYLADLPLVWKYAVRVCRAHQDLQAFGELLAELQPPACSP